MLIINPGGILPSPTRPLRGRKRGRLDWVAVPFSGFFFPVESFAWLAWLENTVLAISPPYGDFNGHKGLLSPCLVGRILTTEPTTPLKEADQGGPVVLMALFSWIIYANDLSQGVACGSCDVPRMSTT